MENIKTEKQVQRRIRFSHTFATPLLVIAIYLLLLITGTVKFENIESDATEAYLALVAIQLFVFMLPSIFYIRARSLDVRDSLRIRLPAPDKIPLILLCSLSLILTSVLMTALYGSMEGSVYQNTYAQVADAGSDTALYYAICYALVPALCEELLFRGIVMSEYQRSSILCAVVMNSLFFSILHSDVRTLPFTFISGLVLSMCAYAANSIIASFLVHLCYNLFAIFGGVATDRVLSSIGMLNMIIILLVTALLLTLTLTLGECQRIYAGYARKNRDSYYVVNYKKGTGGLRFFSALLAPTSLFAIVMYIITQLLG